MARRRILLMLLLPLLVGPMPRPVKAQTYDARGMAMGGVSINQNSGRLARINPAYKAVPQRVVHEAPTTIPLPIGLIQAWENFPELDPNSSDFDALTIINYAANFPWAWQFNRPETLNRDVELTLGRNELIIDLNDARSIIPQEAFTIGGMNSPFDIAYTMNMGQRHGLFHFSFVKPWFQTEVLFDLDQDLRGLLREAEPAQPNEGYGLEIGAMMQAGFTSGITYAREVGGSAIAEEPKYDGTDEQWTIDYWEQQNAKPRFWFGVGYRRYFGLGYARVNGDATLSTGDPIFPTSLDSLDVDYSAGYTQAWANNLNAVGGGNAVDVGMVMRWGKWEVGAGVTDLSTELIWRNTRQYDAYYDENTGQVVREETARDFTSRTIIPRSWLINSVYTSERWLAAFNVVEEPGGTSAKGGGEYWLSPFLAMRGGVELDQRSEVQFGWGAGFRLGGVGLDVGFQTHMRGLTNERIVGMALGLTLY